VSSTAAATIDSAASIAEDSPLQRYRQAEAAAEVARAEVREARLRETIADGVTSAARRALILSVACHDRSCRALAGTSCSFASPYAGPDVVHQVREDLSGINGSWAQGRAMRQAREAGQPVAV
jgi:hypothetical protein